MVPQVNERFPYPQSSSFGASEINSRDPFSVKVSVTSKCLKRFGSEVLPGASSHHWTPPSFTRKATGQLLIKRQTKSTAQTQRSGAIASYGACQQTRNCCLLRGGVRRHHTPAQRRTTGETDAAHRGPACLAGKERSTVSSSAEGTSQLNKATSLA